MEEFIRGVISRLPDYAVTALETNRGKPEAIKALLSDYLQKGIVVPNEMNGLYNEYLKPAARNNYAQPMQFNYKPQENTALNNAMNAYRTQQKINNRGFAASIFMMVVFFFFAAVSFFGIAGESSAEAEKLADTPAAVTAYSDYYIENAELLGAYAEFYTVEKNIGSDSQGSVQAQSVYDLYLAVVTDSTGTEYLTSISVKRESDMGKELKNFNFDYDNYVLTGYFTAKNLSDHKNEQTNETAQDYFYQTLSEFVLYTYNYEKIAHDFEFICHTEQEYTEMAETGTTVGIIMGSMGVLLGAVMIVFAVINKKKSAKAKKELEKFGVYIR